MKSIIKQISLLIVIISLLACSKTSTTEPSQDHPAPSGKITTLMIKYPIAGGTGYTVIHTKTQPDTIVPVYLNQQVRYQKVDSIWGFTQTGTSWRVKFNQGGQYETYGSHWLHTLIKKWCL